MLSTGPDKIWSIANRQGAGNENNWHKRITPHAVMPREIQPPAQQERADGHNAEKIRSV